MYIHTYIQKKSPLDAETRIPMTGCHAILVHMYMYSNCSKHTYDVVKVKKKVSPSVIYWVYSTNDLFFFFFFCFPPLSIYFHFPQKNNNATPPNHHHSLTHSLPTQPNKTKPKKKKKKVPSSLSSKIRMGGGE